MSNTPQVVDGEASESDSEIEIEIGKTPDAETRDPSNILDSVISGEASESEDEGTMTPPVTNHPSPPLPPPMTPNHLRLFKSSILHSRLWEENSMLYRDLETLKLRSLKMAHESLAGMSREIHAVQESVRFADSQVTLARARCRQVKEQLRNCHFQTALPTLKTE